MSNLRIKLRIFKAKSGMKNKDIVNYTGASLQSIVNWGSKTRRPKKLEIQYAQSLVQMTSGYITLKDCGHD